MSNKLWMFLGVLSLLLISCTSNNCEEHADCKDSEICAAAVCRAPALPVMQEYATERATYDPASDNKLINGRKITPHGKSVVVGATPIRVNLTKDGRYAIVNESLWCKENEENNYCKISVIDTTTMLPVTATTPPSKYLWHGMAVAETDTTMIYATSGVNRSLIAFEFVAPSNLQFVREYSLRDCYANNVIVNPAGNTAYVTCTESGVTDLKGSLVRVDLVTGKARLKDDLPGAFSVAIDGPRGEVYVGSVADSIHAENGDSVYVLDADSMALKRQVSTCLGAEEMEFDGNRTLYVSCNRSDEIAVIDTASATLSRTIPLHNTSLAVRGMHPLGMKLSNDKKSLFVTLSHENAVGVIDLSTDALVGMIPTAWYPMTVDVDKDNNLFVVAERGVGDGPSSTDDRIQRQTKTSSSTKRKLPFKDGPNRHAFGMLSKFKLPDAGKLDELSLQVETNNNIQDSYFDFSAGNDTPVPSPSQGTEASTEIEHVFFILQENFSFDQVYGAHPGVTGNPDYVLWGEDDAPNMHKLAREYTLFDQYFCESDSSLDGHQWMAAGIETDFMERHSWNAVNYDFGTIAISLTPGTKPYSEFIMPHLLNSGSTVLAAGGIENFGAEALGIYSDYVLKDFFPLSEPEYLDKDKAQIFIEDFKKREVDGDVPNFTWIFMGNNHGFGFDVGKPIPEFWIQENDEGIGQIVETISNSSIWDKSLIFITQDDAQSGIDSVDNHRCPTLAISPWIKRGYVSHAVYGINNIHKTIEKVLGVPPMHLLDLRAVAMYDAFVARPVTTPFAAINNDVQIEDFIYNGEPNALTKMSASMNWDEIDQNTNAGEFFWRYAKGTTPPAKNALYKHRSFEESEEEEDAEEELAELYKAWRSNGKNTGLSAVEIQELLEQIRRKNRGD